MEFVIAGTTFGSSKGTVTLNNVPMKVISTWGNPAGWTPPAGVSCTGGYSCIAVQVPTGTGAGGSLVVKGSNGNASNGNNTFQVTAFVCGNGT
jgi:hypothetical protein